MISGKTEQELACLVRVLASRTRQEIETAGLSTDDFEGIAKQYELSLEWDALPLDNPGCYLEDRQTIVLNRCVRNQERLNFTFFHELIHHLIKQDDDVLSEVHDVLSAKPLDNVIERLCEVGSAELLMPSDDVRQMILEHGFSTDLIPFLCQRYGASSIAMAIQMASCASHDCYFFIAERQPLSTDSKQPTLGLCSDDQTRHHQLMVVYSGGSPVAKYPMARNIPILQGHLIYSALECEGQTIKGRADIPRKNSKWKEWVVDCDALYYRGKVFAFFNVDSPILSANQLRLF